MQRAKKTPVIAVVNLCKPIRLPIYKSPLGYMIYCQDLYQFGLTDRAIELLRPLEKDFADMNNNYAHHDDHWWVLDARLTRQKHTGTE